MEQKNNLQNEPNNMPESENTLSLITLILGVAGILLLYLYESIGAGAVGASFFCSVLGLYLGNQAKKLKKTTIGKVARGICIYALIASIINFIVVSIIY